MYFKLARQNSLRQVLILLSSVIIFTHFCYKTYRRLFKSLKKANFQVFTKFYTPSCKNENQSVEVCTISECMVAPCDQEPSIVIIGAGMAGLSAAQRLAQCGITNFHILEATDRPGGRIHSCWLSDVIAELGAQYIEGGSVANPIYNLACQEGLLNAPPPRPGPIKGLFCTSDGRAVDTPTSIAAYHAFRQIEQEASMLFRMGCGREHGTLLQFFGIRIQQELNNFPEQMRFDAARVMYGLTNMVREKCGEDLSLVSADQYGSYMSIPGGKLRIPLGYVGVVAPLLRDLPPCSLHYCKAVSRINWCTLNNNSPKAVVKCGDGDEFPCDFVIVTVSLGVLKQHADKLFCPQLPCEKIKAIANLGFGMVNKIFLEYNRPFWAWNNGGIKFAWSPDELANRCDWTKGLSCVEEVEGSRHVLCAYISGPEAAQMELISEEEVVEGITKLLRQFTGDCTLPYPTTVLRSKWVTDPNFYGSYSFLGTNSTVGHQCDLSTPLPTPCESAPPILLFAGEATCVGHYSTVHGARLSGIREAERIVQLVKNKEKK